MVAEESIGYRSQGEEMVGKKKMKKLRQDKCTAAGSEEEHIQRR